MANGIKTVTARAIGVDIPSERLVIVSGDTCRLIMREDEARALRDSLSEQLAEIERSNTPAAPRIGRPKGSRNGTHKRKSKSKRKSKTGAEPESMTPPAHKL